MATLQDLERALIRADAAGDMDAARKLAAAIRAARQDAANQIPGSQIPQTLPQAPEPSMGQKVLGVGEALLTGATGAVGGTVGMIGGTVRGLGESIVNNQMGTPEGVQTVARNAAAGAQALTFAPRTQAGQEIVQSAAQVLGDAVPPVLPMLAAPGQVAQSVRMAAPVAVAAGQRAAVPIQKSIQTATQAIQQRIPAAKTAGGSVGAAGVEMETLRRARANELPVPMGDQMTKGMATRDFEWQRFEKETAKDPALGEPIRERMALMQTKMQQNLDAFVDATGGEAVDLRGAGIKINDALRSALAQAKNKERALYKQAEKAGEMEAPVSTAPLVAFLRENDSFNSPELSGATLGLVERELIRLGGARRVGGELVPNELPLKDVELVRRGVNAAIQARQDNNTNMMTGVQAKQVIDSMTDGMGGEAYKRARAARMQRARDFENVALVQNLLGTKRGSTDRAIALEDVVRKSVIEPSTSLDQLRHLGGVVLKKTPEGRAAWAELQAATVRYIRDEAYKGVTTDTNGNRVLSPAALDRVITNLDKTGKLDYLFGKKGAEQMRTLNDVAKDVFTAPPGAVNTSGTASVLLTALDTMATFGTTGLPVPAVQALRAAQKSVKDRATKRKIQESLGQAK
jgi:hypothetical protein